MRVFMRPAKICLTAKTLRIPLLFLRFRRRLLCRLWLRRLLRVRI